MTIREAEKLLKDAGIVEVQGGKGSHRKFTKKNFPRPVILTSYSKELSKRVEDTVRKAVSL